MTPGVSSTDPNAGFPGADRGDAEKEKGNKYGVACRVQKKDFTSLVYSVDIVGFSFSSEICIPKTRLA